MLRSLTQALIDFERFDVGNEQLDEVQAAICIMLGRVAHADDDYHDKEHACIRDLLHNKLGITYGGVDQLMRAVRSVSSDSQTSDFGCWHIITGQLDDDEYPEIIRFLWEVAYADGTVKSAESRYITRFADYLDITAEQCEDIRKTAEPS
ncbi:TerB family tellurite resistance protein [Magnetospira sp. QH-2]|uniref:tellurite resistance TerB family protein n=1 Tax=Magnetospira sp. (strain QH-2) TaxID=1288970 RepID=UPI0003E81A39|nr:TerB family tellurite resistance protein [Magnetospira sp. QH-2]CCQ74064.1 Protein of unknown function [Magnetospira sp. QH-2]